MASSTLLTEWDCVSLQKKFFLIKTEARWRHRKKLFCRWNKTGTTEEKNSVISFRDRNTKIETRVEKNSKNFEKLNFFLSRAWLFFRNFLNSRSVTFNSLRKKLNWRLGTKTEEGEEPENSPRQQKSNSSVSEFELKVRPEFLLRFPFDQFFRISFRDNYFESSSSHLPTVTSFVQADQRTCRSQWPLS